MLRDCCRYCALVVAGCLSLCGQAADTRPNLLIILADDMGYSDPGCYGGEMATPAIDQLAKNGVRLTHFYNGGMCVISRAAMLTGQWWPKALPNFTKTPLLSEALHENGYRTALVGKWHLAGDPMDRGFDHFFGFLEGFAGHFTGAKSYRLDRQPFTQFGKDFYSSDAFSERAVNFIQSDDSKPFFLYLSFQAPHNPLEAPKADIMAQRGNYAGGWQAVREARFKRQKELGLIPAATKLPAYPENLPDWNSLTPAQRDLEDLRMSVYAAMVERMDRGISKVMKALTDSGKADNTLVLFMSDNGSDSFSVMDQTLLKQGKLPGDIGSNWQLGTGWAYANVTPWRLYKISQHSGGVASGAIASWPAGNLGKNGRIENSPVHMVDVMPTFLEAAQSGNNQAPAAGKSFLPLLKGQAWKQTSPLYFQYSDNRAIRTEEWTLAEVDNHGWELFHTADDPLEVHDLAAKNPNVVAELQAKWLTWWTHESGKPSYTPESSRESPHYKPQGDRGTGAIYSPSAMPAALADRYRR